MTNLWSITGKIRKVLDSLEDGVVSAEDDETLNQLHEDYIQKCKSIAQYLDDLDAEQEALGKHIARLAARRASAVNKHARLKEYLAACMRAAGSPKLDVATHKLTLARPPEQVQFNCEEDIPAKYWKTRKSVDKAAVKADLRAGKVVPGAILVRGLDYVRIT